MRPRPLRWVLDTNVVLSALLRPGGVAGQMRGAWQRGAVVPLVDRTTVAELLRVLAYPKFRLSADEQHELLADYLPWAEIVDSTVAVAAALPPCRDPDDAHFLRLAVMAGADALVSGDADLRVLASRAPLPILGLAEALARLPSTHAPPLR